MIKIVKTDELTNVEELEPKVAPSGSAALCDRKSLVTIETLERKIAPVGMAAICE